MATNKTRLYIEDINQDVSPFNFQAVTEFDLYNEALDYAATIVSYRTNINIYVLSYVNISYRYSYSAVAPHWQRTQIIFPS